MSPIWSPDTYLRYADERGRPFFDLTSRILADEPRRVLDLGCGPGQLTATLAERWPTARVLGVDSSPEMIARAADHAGPRVEFRLGRVQDTRPDGLGGPVDVLVSNATLQWVPGHRALLPALVDLVRPDGWLAFQVPGNFGEDSHRLLRELAADERYRVHTTGTERLDSFSAADYVADLSALGCTVDAWETTYLHVLEGPDPVFEWISGTGARPVLQALPDDLRPGFVEEYKALLRAAYPRQSYGTVLPFRRIFVVARRSTS